MNDIYLISKSEDTNFWWFIVRDAIDSMFDVFGGILSLVLFDGQGRIKLSNQKIRQTI